jgi:hypothetical protein
MGNDCHSTEQLRPPLSTSDDLMDKSFIEDQRGIERTLNKVDLPITRLDTGGDSMRSTGSVNQKRRSVGRNCEAQLLCESVKGARRGNEDYHGSLLCGSENNCVISVVCDGHGGADISKTLGENFKTELAVLLDRQREPLGARDMVDFLRKAYHKAVEVCDATPLHPDESDNQGQTSQSSE